MSPVEWLMAKTEAIRARVDPKLKAEAEAVLIKLGLTASDAIRLFYGQLVLRKGLPFETKVPNAETRRAMKELDEGKGVSYPDAATMFKDLGIGRWPRPATRRGAWSARSRSSATSSSDTNAAKKWTAYWP
jgi:DNA-damage-inducible protein J